MELRHHWQIRIWYECKAEKKRGRGRIEMSPWSLTAALWSHNTGPHWVRCQLFQTNPQQHWLLFEFWMDPLNFSPFTHDVPLSVFYPALCGIWLHGRSFCILATPCSERSSRHKEEVRVYLLYSPLSQAALLLTHLIRPLCMFTYTPLRMIMFAAHAAKPEVCKQHYLR